MATFSYDRRRRRVPQTLDSDVAIESARRERESFMAIDVFCCSDAKNMREGSVDGTSRENDTLILAIECGADALSPSARGFSRKGFFSKC